MSAFSKYDRYKDSSTEWLGDVPEHWEVTPFQGLFDMSPEKNGNEIVGEMLSISGYRGVEQKRYESDSQKRTKEQLADYRVVRRGQLAVNTMWLNYAGLGVSELEGHMSPAYRAYDIRPKLSGRYAHHLLRSSIYVEAYTGMMQGIRPNSMQIKNEDFKKIPVLVPPKPEQDRIVAFLDQKTAEIDALIAKKQRQIELLDEQKAILINRAVTRGLNPKAKLKPSGIESIGDIPEHWEVSSIRRQASFVTSGSRGWAQYSSPSGPLFLRICNLSRGSLEFKLEDIERVQPPRGSEGERTKVTSGDVLISITAFIGSIGVVPDEFEEAYVSQHVALVRIKPGGTHPKWLGYSLLSELGAIQSNLMMYGGTKVGLSLSDVKNYFFPVPPKNEQVEIVAHIAEVFSGYTRGVRQFEKEIQSLKSLRSTLIAHSVTGRIKI